MAVASSLYFIAGRYSRTIRRICTVDALCEKQGRPTSFCPTHQYFMPQLERPPAKAPHLPRQKEEIEHQARAS